MWCERCAKVLIEKWLRGGLNELVPCPNCWQISICEGMELRGNSVHCLQCGYLWPQVLGQTVLRKDTCLSCKGKLKAADFILCRRCLAAALLEHKGLVVSEGICSMDCQSKSVGVVVFAGGEASRFCERHARDFRALDFVPRDSFVPRMVPQLRDLSPRWNRQS